MTVATYAWPDNFVNEPKGAETLAYVVVVTELRMLYQRELKLTRAETIPQVVEARFTM